MIRALERGDGTVDIDKRFEASRPWVYLVKKRFEERGNTRSLPQGGNRVSLIAPVEGLIRDWIAKQPDLTLAELCERLAKELDIALKEPALWRQLNKWGLSFKKTLHDSEQEREDVVVVRRRWRQEQHSMERGRLIFLDETWVNASMTRRYGCSARGARRLASVPHGHWHTNTFLAGLRHDGVQVPWLLDGSLNGRGLLGVYPTCSWINTPTRRHRHRR